MRLDKIIFKAFLKTLAAAAVLVALLIGLLSLAFPQTMMEITYSLGMDKTSVKFSLLSYRRSDRIDYLASGADTALAANLYEIADECLENLLADEGFEEYCNEKNAKLTGEAKATTYQDYYKRQLCLTKYFLGQSEAAVNRAAEFTKSAFAAGNPMVALLSRARLDKQDGAATVQYLYAKMTSIKAGDVYRGYSAADQAYFDEIYAVAAKWAGENIL